MPTDILIGSQKDQAAFLACMLDAHAISVAEVIAWADAIIRAEATPAVEVIEVAAATSAAEADLSALLRALPGDVNERFVATMIVRQFARLFERDTAVGPSVARWLGYASALFGVADLVGDARWQLDDLYYDAVHGRIPVERADTALREALQDAVVRADA